MKPLSKEAIDSRKPSPPEELVEALQDRIDVGICKSRVAKAAKGKGPKMSDKELIGELYVAASMARESGMDGVARTIIKGILEIARLQAELEDVRNELHAAKDYIEILESGEWSSAQARIADLEAKLASQEKACNCLMWEHIGGKCCKCGKRITEGAEDE